MKKLIAITAILFGLIGTAQANNTDDFSVHIAPLHLQANVEVFGTKMGADLSSVIVFTGEQADKLATAIGVNIDPATEMIVLVGNKVDTFINDLVNAAIDDTVDAGHLAFIHTKALVDWAWSNTVGGFINGDLNIIESSQDFLDLLKKEFSAFANNPVIYIADTGIWILKTGVDIIKCLFQIPCRILTVIGLGFLCSDSNTDPETVI